MNDIKTARSELTKLISERYSIKATIDLYQVENLTKREKEILQYGFEEGAKCELLVLLYSLLEGGKDGTKFIADRVVHKVDELKVLIEDPDYIELAEYLRSLRK
jgi:hypothetical protein